MAYRFYGSDTPKVKPINKKYEKVLDQYHMYDLMSHIWSKESCAPRMRIMWSKDNMTLGQCSITSFLVQDIFGGRVFGVPLPDGSYHCFNEVAGVIFDLTSEQFKGERLEYTLNFEQFREEHFKSEEKKARYELIKRQLEEALKKV